MKYNFGDAIKAKESGRFLSAGIKKVVFKGIEYGTVTSQKDGETYKVMSLKLDVENYGEYTQNFFEPQTDERPEMSWGVTASPLDHFLITVREILEAANPQIIKDIDAGKTTLTGTFKQIVDKVKTLTDPYIDKEMQAKFIPGNNGFASMPSFPAKITKNGDLGIATRFIGDNLTLTPQEKKKIDAAAQAKPTNMEKAAPSSAADILSDMGNNLGTDSEQDLGSDLPF